MTYDVIQLPFRHNIREMSINDLLFYRDWFFGIMEQRIMGLELAVNGTQSFESWKADLKPDSLKMLGEWFAVQVNTRPRTVKERENAMDDLAFPIKMADWELTERTFSLAVDVGIYFGSVFKTNHQNLRWEQLLGSRKLADYGQIVIVGFGRVPLNPVRIATTFAYGIVWGKYTGCRLSELYSVWEKMLSTV